MSSKVYRIGELVEAWISPEPMVDGSWVIAIVVGYRNQGNWTDVLCSMGMNTIWIGNVKCVGEKRN